MLLEEKNTITVHKGIVRKYKALDRNTVRIQLKELPNQTIQLAAMNWCVDRGDKLTLVCLDMANVDDSGISWAFGYANHTQGISDLKSRPISVLFNFLCIFSPKTRKLIGLTKKYNHFVTDPSNKELFGE